MILANETAATSYRVLNKYTCELESTGPWSWQCVVENGARLPLATSFDEGFLQLVCRPDAHHKTALVLEDAMLRNKLLAGGVKLALTHAGCGLHLRTDLVVLDEKQLLDRMEWALEGFHDGTRLLESPGAHNECASLQAATVSNAALADLLRECSWPCAERGANDFSAELDANAAPPAHIRMNGSNVELSVELLRCDTSAEITRQALTLYLLTASSSLRMARAYAVHADGQISFGFLVSLPSAPAAEEIHHALSALSVAYRMCARETHVLLHSAAARHYLAARNPSTTNDNNFEKEN